MPCEPKPDTLPAQVVGYLRNHPGAHLSLDDITDKFRLGAGGGNIHTMLAPALDAELLKRERSSDGEWIYRAGKELKPINPMATTVPQRKAPTKRAELDIDQLQVCDDPLPVARSMPNAKYGPLFAGMKPGQAIKCKPEDVMRVGHALRKWIALNNLPLIMRAQARYHSDGQGRVWMLNAPAQKPEAVKLKRAA